MRIAFFDHSYHQKTLSTKFIQELLEELGDVRVFYDESWIDGTPTEWPAFTEGDYDLIVILQVYNVFDILSGEQKNVLFIPMYDGMLHGHDFFWDEKFNKAKVLSFSWKLHQEATRRGAVSKYVCYYPDPATIPAVCDYSAARPFFWYRRPPIDLELVARLCSRSTDRLWLHNSPDPGAPAIETSLLTPEKVTITSWFDSKAEYRKALASCNIFFAPRVSEGIGQSFLEAMAAGLCVVAPNASTMNEYVTDGVTGLIYDVERPAPLDFTRIEEIGKRAREAVERGRRRWIQETDELLEFAATSLENLKSRDPMTQLLERVSAADILESDCADALPKASVVIVRRDPAADVEETMNSLRSQNYEHLESMIVDAFAEKPPGAFEAFVQRVLRRGRSETSVNAGMKTAISACSGEWIIFMNAGDIFVGPNAATRIFRHASRERTVLYGHYLQIGHDGAEEIRSVADIGTSWSRLLDGNVDLGWLNSVPALPATAFRKEMLQKLECMSSGAVTMEGDLAFRAHGLEGETYHTDEVVSICRGELSPHTWLQIAKRYGGAKAEANLLRALANSEPAAENRIFISSFLRQRAAEFSFTISRLLEKIEPIAPLSRPLSEKIRLWGNKQWRRP